jgi:hypothetical protein
MATISVSLPADGSTADVADVNTPITTIVNAINGNLDSNNISSLNGSKLVAASVPGSALDATTTQGWIAGLAAPNTITALGNRCYSMVWNSVNYSGTLSAGMRARTTRTVAAPTQCTSLNGSTQYYSKSSPAGMTFTNNFTVMAYVKATSYAAGAVISRYNGTNGWLLQINSSGQVQLQGFNGGIQDIANSYQSIGLNKWVHVAATMDMSGNLSNIYIDGVAVAVNYTNSVSTALVQAGNLEIGSFNGGTTVFSGKIAQTAVFSAVISQATIQSYISQGLSGTETSLISAYSFNNTLNDLNTTNANNLTANGSAVATTTDSPFGGQADGTISSTLDYAEFRSVTFSTNTTAVVQVPRGNTIPTSGGVSAVVYSPDTAPFGFPGGTATLGDAILCNSFTSAATSATQILGLSVPVTVPTGVREVEITLNVRDVFRTGGGITDITLWAGNAAGTLTTQIAGAEPNAPSGSASPMTIIWKGILPSGTTYVNAALSSAATANSTLEATTVAPTQLNVWLLP